MVLVTNDETSKHNGMSGYPAHATAPPLGGSDGWAVQLKLVRLFLEKWVE